MAKKKNKVYVVWVGYNPGIYKTWAECKAQINGFSSAKFKSFKTSEEAEREFERGKSIYPGPNKPIYKDINIETVEEIGWHYPF